ncbi:MAG: cache domain-containing protein [Geobacteraceae bacterium]|nr:cache domain-containing protein [Geobacteraceae bacterium]
MLKRRFPIRTKLTVATILPLSVAILICTIASFSILLTKIGSQAQEKVRSDLNAAREIYQREIDHLRDIVRFTATTPYVADSLKKIDKAHLGAVLEPLLNSEKLDLFGVVDAGGTVVFRAHNRTTTGDDLSRDYLVKRALKGETIAGTTVLPKSRLEKEGEYITSRALINIRPTKFAVPSTKTVEDSGMFLIAAAPVRARGGAIVGAIYCAVLLNNNNELVDRIKNVVSEGGKADNKSSATSSIILNDVRIATNVIGSDSQRSIGTRISEEVYRRVVLMNEKWIDRAFVVNDWYFSAYEPISSLEGAPLGAFYVGMLEKPYTRLKFNIILLISSVLLISGLMGTVVARAAASRLAYPIKELESFARNLAAGRRGERIEKVSDDEIGDLADAFNRMSAALTEKETEILELNRSLEVKVHIRTAELEEKSRLLVEAKEDLSKAERLAAIGELAAGVAHEINNPLSIIRGNSELLQMDLPPDSSSLEEVDIISRAVGRIERIVANLLKFARRENKRIGRVEIASMLEEILSQVGHQVPLEGITIERCLDQNVEIEGDSDQLHQVFTNLVLNAVQSMPEGGLLTVSDCSAADDGGCEVIVSDTGTGISAENLEKIFNPFFTTRSQGTGLGLSVSYGIVKDHDGEITVESRQGVGTSFKVKLPLSQSDK